MKTKRLNGTVDVGDKPETRRTARAQACIKVSGDVLKLIMKKKVLKGDVLEGARLAGIIAAKRTDEIIPLCHPLRMTDIKISFHYLDQAIKVISEVQAIDRTGVEMEALTACTVSALTIYDMCKMYDKSMEITDVMLLEKQGGRSGAYRRGQ